MKKISIKKVGFSVVALAALFVLQVANARITHPISAGTISSGSADQIAYYSDSTTIAGTTTIPSAVQDLITRLGNISTAINGSSTATFQGLLDARSGITTTNSTSTGNMRGTTAQFATNLSVGTTTANGALNVNGTSTIKGVAFSDDVVFTALLSTNQTNVTSSANVVVLLDEISTNLGSGGSFSTTTNQFTFTQPGYYSVYGQTQFTASEDGRRYDARIHLNTPTSTLQGGALFLGTQFSPSSTASMTPSVYGVYHFAANDYIDLRTRHTSDSVKTLQGATGEHLNYLVIERIR